MRMHTAIIVLLAAFALPTVRAWAQLPTGTVSAVVSEDCPAVLNGEPADWVTGTSGGNDVQTACYHATVSCPQLPDLGVTYGIATPSTVSNGTIVFVSAAGGTVLQPGAFQSEIPFDLFHAGYQTVQFAWDAWWQSLDKPTGQNLKVLACRVATFLNYISTNYYKTNSNNSPTAGMCVQALSGGAGGLGFSMTYYGAGAYLDKAVFGSGPQYGDLLQGCAVPNAKPVSICPNQNGSYPMGCNSLAGTWTESPTYTGGAALNITVELGNHPPCNNPKHIYSQLDAKLLTATSIVDQASDASYNYPQTAVAAWECDDDSFWKNPSEVQGWLYLSHFTDPSQIAPNCNYTNTNTPFPTACFSVNRVYGCTSVELATTGFVCRGNVCPVCTGNPPTHCTCGGLPCQKVAPIFSMVSAAELDYKDSANGCIKRHP